MLKNLTQTFKDNCNAREVILSEYVILDNIKIPIKAELNDDCYNEGNFIGTFIFKELRFETSNEYDFKKKEFKYYKVVNGESVKIGTFITTEITDNDTEETIKVVAMDYGLKTQVEYTSNLNYGSGNITLLDVWNENCELSGIGSGITTFTNSNFIVDSDQFSGTGATRRDVFIAIAQSSCDFVKIGNDDKIYLILKEETNEVIEEYTDLEDKRDTQPINAVSLGMSQVEGEILTKIADGVSEKNANWLVINDNPFAYTQEKRQQLINGIFNKINGFGYSAFKTETSFKPYLTCGDLVKFKRKDGVLVNSIILRYKHNFDNITLEAPSIVKATVNYVRPESAIDIVKRTELIVDKQNQQISSVVSKVDKQNEQISMISQDVGELNSKITNIANITSNGETTFANLSLDNINESEPIEIKIHPTSKNISYLYPRNNLYPSNDLYTTTRTLRFKNKQTDEIFDYELPTDLLFYDNDNYDEFYLNYDSQSCQITKKCRYDADGNVLLLDNPIVNIYDYPKIYLTDGDYEISILGYSNGYLYARLMAANLYTTQFATKVELKSSISQTANEINLEVSKKVGQDEIISKINQTPETISIEANKINISGVMNAINNNTTTSIDGNKITTGTIDANKIKSNSITANEVASDIITTTNFKSQQINADNITTGTLSADKINGGTITASDIKLKGVSLTPSTSSIGGLNVASGTISNSRMGLDTSNGVIRVFNNNGGSMILSNAVRLSATAGVGISSNSNGNISAPSKNLDIKACGGAVAYLGCMSDSAGTNEKSAVSCENGALKFRSTGYCSYNGTTVFNSSSRATKENIVDLTQEKKDEVYELIKNIPTKQYDYKEQYGKKFNYGFIIEDIENTKLNDLLHISQSETNKDIKLYSTEDLVRLQLITIQELMKKNEELEKRIKIIEKEMK